MTVATIHAKDLAFAWDKTSLYQQLSVLTETPGIYGLFGRNGSGKSTLLKLLAGLLRPQQGSLQVLGYTPRERHPDFLAQVYILPEEFHLPNLTPLQLQRSQSAFYPQFNDACYTEYLQVLEVPEQQRFAEMSLGQKKKAAIAFALATQTPLLLMDEPTNGLDIVSRGQFRALMRRPEQAQRTILISTHQAHDLESILSHLWFIDHGRIVLDMAMVEVAQRLHMGVAQSPADLPSGQHLVYQEAFGGHTLWIAQRDAQVQGEPGQVQLELLYKAMSLQPEAVRKALQQEESYV